LADEQDRLEDRDLADRRHVNEACSANKPPSAVPNTHWAPVSATTAARSSSSRAMLYCGP